MRERLSAPPAAEIVRYLYGPRIERQRRTFFQPMLVANRAHVVMLVRQGIVDPETAAALLQALQELEDVGPDGIQWNPLLEDMHYNIEAWLIDRIGAEVGGRLHTARSRVDLYATLARMQMRERLLAAATGLLGLREQMLDLASSQADTVMTGYTHNQPAQPITLGHYLSAIIAALERDNRRFGAAYTSTNQCPLGAGAVAGTSFPVDRELVAVLLGFEGVVANTIDAVASRDYVGDALYAVAMAGTVLSRFATDLYTWVSFEYGYLELSDAAAGTSSIMPQKKNPSALEHVRAKAAHVHAALLSAMACWKNTEYTHSREISQESVHHVEGSFSQLEAMYQLVACCLRDIKVNEGRMRQALDRNYAVATDFADALVQEGGLPFRVAHQVVGTTVRELAAQPGVALSGEAVLGVLAKRGLSVPLSAERLAELASPEVAVARRSHLGGPAPDEVRRMVAEQRECLAADYQTWEARRTRLIEAEERLRNAVASAQAENTVE